MAGYHEIDDMFALFLIDDEPCVILLKLVLLGLVVVDNILVRKVQKIIWHISRGITLHDIDVFVGDSKVKLILSNYSHLHIFVDPTQ